MNALVQGVFSGPFHIVYQCSKSWGFAGLKLFAAADYDEATGNLIGGEDAGKKVISQRNNGSNNINRLSFWDGTTNVGGLLVDTAGTTSDMAFWRDANDVIRYRVRDSGAWTEVTTWADDLVAGVGLQSPSWVRLKNVENFKHAWQDYDASHEWVTG